MNYHNMTDEELITAAQSSPASAALVIALAERLAGIRDRLEALNQWLDGDGPEEAPPAS